MIEILVAIFKITKLSSIKLQGPLQNLYYAMEGLWDCMTVLMEFGTKESVHKEIFLGASRLYRIFAMPRIIARQRNYSNLSSTSQQQCYRRAVFLPYIGTIIMQLKRDFSLLMPIVAF